MILQYPQLQKIDNFRDLGGYATKDGYEICGGKIFRCGVVKATSKRLVCQLVKLNIKHILDLRSGEEIADSPDTIIEGCSYYAISAIHEEDQALAIKPSMMLKFIRDKNIDKLSKSVESLQEVYARLPFDNPAYRQMFKIMDSGDNFLFHCTAGKDRTGVGAMLILLALGVSRQDAVSDYMLSNVYRKKPNDKLIAIAKFFVKDKQVTAIVRDMLYIKQTSIEASIDAIFNKYATFEEFLLKEYGVTPQRVERWKVSYCVKAN